MGATSPTTSKRIRAKYSRLICLGCRERRIRCELAADIEPPNLGEVRTAPIPCHRCKRLGLACVIRQSILGRPGTGKALARDVVPRTSTVHHADRHHSPTAPPVAQQMSSIPSTLYDGHDQSSLVRWFGNTLLFHSPQSSNSVLIIHALDTLQRERVEHEWFRHLPRHAGHTPALDLSIQALVTACGYSRGAAGLTSEHCYKTLSIALDALQALLKDSQGTPSDHILAATALLIPFEHTEARWHPNNAACRRPGSCLGRHHVS